MGVEYIWRERVVVKFSINSWQCYVMIFYWISILINYWITFFYYILHTCKISKWLEINNYLIIKYLNYIWRIFNLKFFYAKHKLMNQIVNIICLTRHLAYMWRTKRIYNLKVEFSKYWYNIKIYGMIKSYTGFDLNQGTLDATHSP